MWLHISIPQQTLSLFSKKDSSQADFQCPISSAEKGIGSEFGSYQTPVGNFSITQKIGAGAPIFTNFKGRQARSVWSAEQAESDAILSRIIRLDGLDPENENTWERYIYLHGTHQENLIGQPASHGCIRMKNEDIIALFDLVPLGTEVTIQADL